MHIFTPPTNFSKVSRILLSLLTLLILQTGFVLAQNAPFITVWQTDNPGSSEDNQITIPGTGINYLIEWEEVGNEANNNGSETGTNEHTITFPSAGTYRVKISGNFTRIEFRSGGDKEKILDIEQWGDIAWSSFLNAFSGCINLIQTANDIPDLSIVTNMERMFDLASSFTKDLDNWDVSNVTNMRLMFNFASYFNGKIGSWNVSKVTDMTGMFQRAESFNQDLDNWDVSNVTNMSFMFSSTNVFNGSIGRWDVSKVTDMSFMFQGASSFNKSIESWNVSNVINMRRMFWRCKSFNQDLSSWDISNVKNMTNMLNESSLNTYNYDHLLKGWADLPNISSNINMGSDSLKYCLSNEARNFLINEKGWSISGDFKDCESGFFSCLWKTDNEGLSEDDQITIPGVGTDYLVYWQEVGNTVNRGQEIATDTHTITFPNPGTYRIKIYGDFTRINFSDYGDKLKIIEIENWGEIQWASMNSAFAGTKNLTISGADDPDLTLLTDMSYMFYGTGSFDQDISQWDVSNVTKMTKMFAQSASFNEDINAWNVSNVTDMSGMFYEASSFDQNLGAWDLSNVNSLVDFLSFSGLSLSNYDLSLEGWATSDKIPSNIELSAEGLYYCASTGYRQQLIDDFGWNIIGDDFCNLTLEDTFPASEATLAEKNTKIFLTFNHKIKELDFSGIKITDETGAEVPISNIFIDNSNLFLEHNGLGSNTYEVMIPGSSINLIANEAITNEAISWKFTTQRFLSSKDQLNQIDHSAFPNPFSDFTTIEFNLPQTQSVNLFVFDLKGQLIRTEQYDNLGSDNQSIKFERRGLPEGLYRYQLQSAGGAVGGKMLIE